MIASTERYDFHERNNDTYSSARSVRELNRRVEIPPVDGYHTAGPVIQRGKVCCNHLYGAPELSPSLSSWANYHILVYASIYAKRTAIAFVPRLSHFSLLLTQRRTILLVTKSTAGPLAPTPMYCHLDEIHLYILRRILFFRFSCQHPTPAFLRRYFYK